MIEKLPENKDKVFKTETGEYLTIPELSIPKPVSDKINELVDAVNELQTKVNKLAQNINFAQPKVKENVQKEPTTLLDIFNEMGEMYSSLWNKMEDIHHDLKTKGAENE